MGHRGDRGRQVHGVVSLLTCTESTGTSSVKVRIRVDAERYDTGESVTVTEAKLSMVSVDARGRPIPFRSPPSVKTRTVEGLP